MLLDPGSHGRSQLLQDAQRLLDLDTTQEDSSVPTLPRADERDKSAASGGRN